MAEGRRSPFGELVRHHRLRLGLSRPALARKTQGIVDQYEADRSNADPDNTELEATPRLGSLTERALMRYEDELADPALWVTPRSASVRTLIVAFELEPGTDDYQAFVDAAAATGVAMQAVETLPLPARDFVDAGREPQLEQLRRAVQDAVEGAAGVVFVSGEMGMGKTWLIREACRRAVAQHPELVTLWASCSGAEGIIDIHQPFRQLLGQMVGDVGVIGERRRISPANTGRIADRIPVAIRTLAARGRGLVRRALSVEALDNDLLAAIADDTVRADTELLLTPEPVSLSPAGRRHHHLSPVETSEQLLSVFEGYAAAGPVVLVLDDLHLADGASIAAVSYLVRRLHLRETPLLILGSVRTGPMGIDRLGRQHPVVSVLNMAERLSAGAVLDLDVTTGDAAGRAFVRAMISRSGGDPSPQEVESLFRKTRGQAILVSWFLSTGQRDEDGQPSPGATVPNEGTGSDRLPAEMKMMFDTRLGRLSELQREALFAASVQGETFSTETLIDVLDISNAEFIEQVDTVLVRQEQLMAIGPTVAIADQAVREYRFQHASLRDYLYFDVVGPMERSHYHRDTAEALIDRFGATDHGATERIAFHFYEAGERGRAAVAYLHAGDYAAGRREFERALALYRRVGEMKILRSDPSTYIRAQIGLGDCYRSLGQAVRGRILLDQALELANQHELPVIAGHAQEALAMLDFDAGRNQEGIDRMRIVVAIWREAGYRDTPRALANLGYLLHGQGRYDDAMTQAREGMALADRLGERGMWIDAALGLAACHMDLGMFHEAIAIYEQCRALAEEVGDAHHARLCWLNISLASIELGEPEAALDLIERRLANQPGMGILLTAAVELNLGLATEDRGDLAAAREHYETSRSIRDRLGVHALMVDSLAGLLRVATRTGDRAAMERLASGIISRMDARGLDGIEHVERMFMAVVEASLALDDRDTASAIAARGVAAVRERAGRITDPAQRASYLAVTSRRRLLELASSLGAPTLV